MKTSRETIETKPMLALRDFFSAKSRSAVSMPEFSEFWKACSEAEKTDYKALIQAWDGESFMIPIAKA